MIDVENVGIPTTKHVIAANQNNYNVLKPYLVILNTAVNMKKKLSTFAITSNNLPINTFWPGIVYLQTTGHSSRRLP